MSTNDDPETVRLSEADSRTRNWKRWGPYLSERQWGTVREDYSTDGDPWWYFTHDHAVSRAYRWGEDGLLGITDRECRLCFSLAMWNGRDSILKERLFGLTNHEGNHGEDVKECYWYLDATPTSSYLKGLYRYPQAEFPYRKLLEANRQRGRQLGEYELIDTGVFEGNRFFDVVAEYAKADVDDLLIRITATNRGPDAATLHLLPTIWFRNTWVWGCNDESCWAKPRLKADGGKRILTDHPTLGKFQLESATQTPMLFTENESNNRKLFGSENLGKHTKDAFHEYLVRGNVDAVNPKRFGTKAALLHRLELQPGESKTIELRLRPADRTDEPFGENFQSAFRERIAEADRFYEPRTRDSATPDEKRIARQAYAGLLWSKQFYYYIVDDWLAGDPRPTESAIEPRRHPQRGLEALLRPRHPVDAR